MSDWDNLHELCKSKDINYISELQTAIINGHIIYVQFLLIHHLDKLDLNNVSWKWGLYIPLWFANDVDIMMLLLQAKTNPHYNDQYECSVLCSTVQDNNHAYLEKLIDCKIDLNQREVGDCDRRGRRHFVRNQSKLNFMTLLHTCDNSENGQITCKMLLDAKADPNVTDKDGVCVLDYAISKDQEEKVQLLVNAKADLSLSKFDKFVKYFIM